MDGDSAMKIVFISNYFNHHQRPLSDALYQLTEGNYCFIETMPMRVERWQLGYGQDHIPVYVKTAYLSQEMQRICHDLVMDADVVIAGSAPEEYLRNRMRAGKLIFRYGERPLKQGMEPLKYLPRLLRWNHHNPAKKPVYLLAASAYAVSDYAKFGLFQGKAYQWGYFPETKHYLTMPQKNENAILWVGRFLDWKHPDDALFAAAKLRDAGYDFTLDFIGAGAMETKLREMISKFRLEDRVCILGTMRPEMVRTYMENASIFILSSDRQEGWGAVVNEAMNSGCAVVASYDAGCVPYLLEDNRNGLIYRSGDVDMLMQNVKYLLDHPDACLRMGYAAYQTIVNTWNADTAAQRLVTLSEGLLNNMHSCNVYAEGPCSLAEKMHANERGKKQ